MITYQQFLHDAARVTHRQGLDTEPVCYMGEETYRQFLADMHPSDPVSFGPNEKRFSGIQVYRVRDDQNHYHMTFRSTR